MTAHPRPSRARRAAAYALAAYATAADVVLAAAAVTALATCADHVAGPGDGVTVPRRALTATEQQTLRASNAFAFDLLRTLGAAPPYRGNLVVSPYSGVAALGMLLNGAGGTTLAGMQQALGNGAQAVSATNATFRDLTTYLLGADRSVTVRTANSVWTMTGFPVRPEFAEAVKTNFDAEARTVSFGTREATQAVNAWASDKTNGLIPKVFADGQPDASTVALLVNALHFKGTWTHRFEVASTGPAPFRLANGTTAQVPTMRRSATAMRAGGAGGIRVGELAYGNGAYVMTFVLPAPGSDLDALAASLTPERWDALLATLGDIKQDVVLPKFTLQGETVWNEALKQLGMRDAFAPRTADFSPLSAACLPAGPRDCYLSIVKQNIDLRVDEEGTEAAAVTSTGMSTTSLPPSFIVDRPFLFAVRERASGAILFIGRVTDPRG